MDKAIEHLKEITQREDRKVMEFLKLLHPSLSEDEIVELVAREARDKAGGNRLLRDAQSRVGGGR